jgi:hypothetical protein
MGQWLSDDAIKILKYALENVDIGHPTGSGQPGKPKVHVEELVVKPSKKTCLGCAYFLCHTTRPSVCGYGGDGGCPQGVGYPINEGRLDASEGDTRFMAVDYSSTPAVGDVPHFSEDGRSFVDALGEEFDCVEDFILRECGFCSCVSDELLEDVIGMLKEFGSDYGPPTFRPICDHLGTAEITFAKYSELLMHVLGDAGFIDHHVVPQRSWITGHGKDTLNLLEESNRRGLPVKCPE